MVPPAGRVEVTLEVLECEPYDRSRNFEEHAIVSHSHPLRRTGDGTWSGEIELSRPGSVPPTYMTNMTNMTNADAQIRWVLRAKLSGKKLPRGEALETVWLDATPQGAARRTSMPTTWVS